MFATNHIWTSGRFLLEKVERPGDEARKTAKEYGVIGVWRYCKRLYEQLIGVNFFAQDDVESIASKNPKELTGLLEQISGSDELNREYDALEEQKAKAEEKKHLFIKKKTIVMKRKQKKEQKEEAEKHLRLQDQLKSLKREHFLWQLLNIEKDMEKVNEHLEAETRSREDVLKEQKDYELEESSKRREQAGYLKEITLREKRIADKKSIIDKKQLVVAIAPAFLFVFLLYKLLVLSLVTSSFSKTTEAFEVKGGSISHQFKNPKQKEGAR
ncbi:hypothetical protein IFM89_023461 [Coptis chinensis]|uniref:Uncharacterized protein n=1 Tax=Coptis chinensis TaxID=261450 RepID=A0A835HDQ8_9MAGN|nr:hypothetical protein IFM89_023461 [Coptis chinensis]